MLKRIVLIIFILLSVSACGEQVVMISREFVTTEGMQSICSNAPCKGHYEKVDNICHIWTFYPSEYPSDIEYHQTLGHETRHCFEGKFHDSDCNAYIDKLQMQLGEI